METFLAERMGFEPMKEFPLYTLSKRAPSTTRPPLQKNQSNIKSLYFSKLLNRYLGNVSSILT